MYTNKKRGEQRRGVSVQLGPRELVDEGDSRLRERVARLHVHTELAR